MKIFLKQCFLLLGFKLFTCQKVWQFHCHRERYHASNFIQIKTIFVHECIDDDQEVVASTIEDNVDKFLLTSFVQ